MTAWTLPTFTTCGRRRGKLISVLLFLATICATSCRDENPQDAYQHARKVFARGDLVASQQEADRGYQRFRSSNGEWAWKFKILEAESLLWSGRYGDVLALLGPSTENAPRDLVVSILALDAVALGRQLDLDRANEKIEEAEKLCVLTSYDGCGEAFQARGLLALGQNQFGEARQQFQRSLSFAKLRGEQFLETTSLLNLSDVLLKENFFDEAVDRSNEAYQAALAMGADDIALAAEQNLAWAYYRLGDSTRALSLLVEAEKRAEQLGDTYDVENGLTNIGYVHLDERDFETADRAFQDALKLARNGNRKEHVLNALRVLARLSVLTSDLTNANQYAEQALQIARESGNRQDELYPMLVEGQISAKRGDGAQAEKTFQQIERDPVCPIFLKWEAQQSLAQLYEDEKQLDAANHEYRSALATFESARDSVRHEDFQLSFLTNAARTYDDYIHFLVSQGKSDEALRWADYSRARTLSEGLGLLSKGASRGEHAGPPPLKAQEISQRAKGTLLFYWLGEKQSYLWAITPHNTSLFPLPPGAEIDALVQRYRKAINGPQDVLTSSEEARSLYRTLIVPAQSLLSHDGKVFIIPDGSLNNLNFETLVVPTPTEAKSSEGKPAEPKPHFWIEDAEVANASSLRVLAASFSRDKVRANVRQKNPTLKLLLIGDSVAPSKDYPELPRAAEQMASVSRHFPEAEQQVYQHKQATPAAYLASNPEQFSHIHFVAHGTASRLSPLDSAIVLSPPTTDTGSFKLYARDIVAHPLQADLVTISACYGAGERAYSGEGLVGLAWAFLRAGAHNVIAGLWEVTDASTEQLMDRFYDELGKGASPDAALRTAKLSLLHNGAFRNPFYWAPFQLYTGS
jgi:CHAT domain-containing protein/Tfp pilus assembly protein PilF